MSRLRVLGAILVLLLAQQAVTVVLPPWVRPDFLLAAALALGLRQRATESLILAFGLGFMLDALSVTPMGLYALLRGTACAAARLVDRSLFLRAPTPWLLLTALWGLIDGLLLGALLGLFAPEAAPGWTELLARVPGNALATAVVALPTLVLIQWADGETDADSGSHLVGSRS